MRSIDYPGALWLPAHESNYLQRDRPLANIAFIVIHITDGHEKAVPVAKMWQEPGHGSSAHFVVGQSGEVVQSVAITDVAYHAHAANKFSIGIEHCARTPKELSPLDPGLPVSRVQYAASATLVKWLCALIEQPVSRDVIRGHCEIDRKTTHKDCPNAIWDWAYYMSLLEQPSPQAA